MRKRVADCLRDIACRIEGRPEKRGPIERAQDVATDPRLRRRVVVVAWAVGVVVGEFLLPATSPLGELLETFMHGAGYEQQRPGRIGPYPTAPGHGGGPGGDAPDGQLLEQAPAGPGLGP